MKKMNRVILIIFLLSLLFFQSCFLIEDEITVISGTVKDKITKAHLADVPIEIRECDPGFFGSSTICDSFTTIYTNTSGEFELLFESRRDRIYELKINFTEAYGGTYLTDIIEGESNDFEFELMPFIDLELLIKSSKENKNFLSYSISRASFEATILGSNNILSDTLASSQDIDTTVYRKVFPLNEYQITKKLCNRTGEKYNYKYTDCRYEHSEFYVSNEDTVSIVIQ